MNLNIGYKQEIIINAFDVVTEVLRKNRLKGDWHDKTPTGPRARVDGSGPGFYTHFENSYSESETFEKVNYSPEKMDYGKASAEVPKAIKAGLIAGTLLREDANYRVVAETLAGDPTRFKYDQGKWNIRVDDSDAARAFSIVKEHADEAGLASLSENLNICSRYLEINLEIDSTQMSEQPSLENPKPMLFPHPEELEATHGVNCEWHYNYGENHDPKIGYKLQITRYAETDDYSIFVMCGEGPTAQSDIDLRSSFADAYEAAYKTAENLGVNFVGISNPKHPGDASKALKLADAIKDAENIKTPATGQPQQQTSNRSVNTPMQEPLKVPVR